MWPRDMTCDVFRPFLILERHIPTASCFRLRFLAHVWFPLPHHPSPPFLSSFGPLVIREQLRVDIRASTSAQARVARALLLTHLKSRAELLRLEQSRRSMEGSVSAFEVGLGMCIAARAFFSGCGKKSTKHNCRRANETKITQHS